MEDEVYGRQSTCRWGLVYIHISYSTLYILSSLARTDRTMNDLVALGFMGPSARSCMWTRTLIRARLH